MKVIGARIWLMVKELILIREVLNMLESGRMIYKMVMDLRNGQMVLNIKLTIFLIQGNYKEGKKSGQGILHFADGSRYEGEFLDNEISGVGKYFWYDGKIYSG